MYNIHFYYIVFSFYLYKIFSVWNCDINNFLLPRAWSVCVCTMYIHLCECECGCVRACACMSVYVHCTCMHVCVCVLVSTYALVTQV